MKKPHIRRSRYGWRVTYADGQVIEALRTLRAACIVAKYLPVLVGGAR